MFYARNTVQRLHTPSHPRITISICFTTRNITSPSPVPLYRLHSHHVTTYTLLLCIQRCTFDLIQSLLLLLFTSGIATWARDYPYLLHLPAYCIRHSHRSELKHVYDVDKPMHHLIPPVMILLLRTVTAFLVGRRFDPIPLHLLPVSNHMLIWTANTSQVAWVLYIYSSRITK